METSPPVPIDERARRYVAKLPAGVTGCNRHAATFHAAFVLLNGFCLPDSVAYQILQEFNARCEPPSDEHKLKHRFERAKAADQVAKNRGWALRGGELKAFKTYRGRGAFRQPGSPKKFVFEKTALSKFAGSLAGNVDLVWLANRSDQDPCVVTPSRFLELVYRTGEKVVVFTEYYSQGQAIWPVSGELPMRGKNGVWFLAQPVDGEYHPNPRSLDKQTGKARMSRRSEESVTSWRHFVVESDEANLKQWLAAIVQLPLRIVALYTSGSRSVHALLRVDARTKAEWDEEKAAMKAALVTLGADPGAMSAVRLSRLPGCWREGKTVEQEQNGKKFERYTRFPRPQLQKLLFVNPDPPLRPICELTPRRDVLKQWLDCAGYGISDADETNGEALTRALHYYAPVSEECREALRKILRQRAIK